MVTREYLIESAKRYDSNKYSEKFYSYYLDTIQNENDIESLSEAIKCLFLWKLGKIRPHQTQKSSPIETPSFFEKQYYTIPTTSSNENAIVKAIETNMIKSAISFRDGGLSYDDFKNKVLGITSSSIVLPSFFVHIMQPERYPILDEKVWKVYCKEKQKPISKNTKPRNWVDYEKYTRFFNETVEKTNLDRRTVDRGLWFIGSELKENMKCSDAKTTKETTNFKLLKEKQASNNHFFTYRGRNIYSFKLTASRVVPNVKMEKLTELLVGIAEILNEKRSPEHFVKKKDCEHLCSNYTDFQNLLYQIGFLDKIGHGKYILTNEGTKVSEGEPFCKHLMQALLNLVKYKKETDRHALLLLWIYYRASLNGQPRPEYFQKMDEYNSYPKIRYEVGKTMMVLLSNCFDNDMEKINGFFDEWEQLLN